MKLLVLDEKGVTASTEVKRKTDITVDLTHKPMPSGCVVLLIVARAIFNALVGTDNPTMFVGPLTEERFERSDIDALGTLGLPLDGKKKWLAGMGYDKELGVSAIVLTFDVGEKEYDELADKSATVLHPSIQPARRAMHKNSAGR